MNGDLHKNFTIKKAQKVNENSVFAVQEQSFHGMRDWLLQF